MSLMPGKKEDSSKNIRRNIMELYGLKVSYIPGISFSWKLAGAARQVSYRIVVRDQQGVITWDSGCVESADRHNIRYPAEPEPQTLYEWTVTVCLEDGTVCEGEGIPFSGGISEWKADWVEPDRVRKPLTDSTTPIHGVVDQRDPFEVLDPAVDMRKTFILDEMPDKALLFYTARGICDLYVNGTKVSDMFAPGYTSYGSRIEYQCVYVRDLLAPGENVIAATLADGWFTGKVGAVGIGQQYGTENALLFQLEVCSGDTVFSVCSDSNMKFAESAWQYADLFVGSAYDESLERKGWMQAGYDDSAWKPVRTCACGYDTLVYRSIDPVCEQRVITPSVFRAPNGDLVLDAGEIIVGFTSVKLDMKAGDVLKLEHTELLDQEGNFMINIIGQNKNQTDILKAAVDGVHEWQPEFTFHGFRYVRVSGTDDMDPEHYAIHVVHTPLQITGSFHCDDERLNKLQENILRSQSGNMVCIPTDCPQREKTGWTGDMQVYAPTACYEMDVEQFVRHWLADMRSEQLADGQMPHIIPYIPSHDIMKPAWIDGVSAGGWSDACVIVPWRLYEAYGDVTILEENYEMMERYMASCKVRVAMQPANCESTGEHMQYIWNNDFQYGDWLMPSAVKSGLVGPPMMMLTGFEAGTLMYAYTNLLMVSICKVLGRDAEAAAYEETYHKVCEAFMIEFGNEDGTLKKDYQGLYVLALQMGAIPENKRQNAVDKLVSLIHENGDRLDTGFLSIPFLLPVLHDCGEAALANTLLFQDKEPSWLYEIKCGATTLWESWDAIGEDGVPKDYSMNHFAFGCVGEYLFKYIAGIRATAPGFKEVRIEPDFSCGLKEVEASYDSSLGEIKVHWKLDGEKKTLDVVLPPDMKGIVAVDGKECVTEGRFSLSH